MAETARASVPDSAWSSRRVMVTGADGFVGRWLTRALSDRGAFVIAVVRKAAKTPVLEGAAGEQWVVAEGNVSDAGFIRRQVIDHDLDTVFHLAGVNVNRGSDFDPRPVLDAHVFGICAVLEACRTAGKSCGLVLASSHEVEDCFTADCPRTMHPYMASKAAAELLARSYHDTFGVPLIVLRCQNIYGGGDTNWGRIVPGTIRSLLRGERPVIRGSGRLQRDYVHVDDAVAAYIAAAERLTDPSATGAVFRVATGSTHDAREVVSLLTELAGRDDLSPLILDAFKDERVDRRYAPERERVLLGWQSRIDVREGLARTLDWYVRFFRHSDDNPAATCP